VWSSHTVPGEGVLMWSSVYGVVNVVFLSLLSRVPQTGEYWGELD
jgi:hypothetical protein